MSDPFAPTKIPKIRYPEGSGPMLLGPHIKGVEAMGEMPPGEFARRLTEIFRKLGANVEVKYDTSPTPPRGPCHE